jgi:hypothetical protein
MCRPTSRAATGAAAGVAGERSGGAFAAVAVAAAAAGPRDSGDLDGRP